MRITPLAVAAGAALVLVPSTVFAGPPAGKGKPQGQGNAQVTGASGSTATTGASGTTGTSGATGASGPNGNAYGRRCQAASKEHVKGTKGTPFSQCVKALAQLDSGKAATPARACKAAGKKKVKGMKGTPYSVCVKAAKKQQATA